MSEFGWILAIVSLVLKWEGVRFGFLLHFGVVVGLKRDFLVKKGQIVACKPNLEKKYFVLVNFWIVGDFWVCLKEDEAVLYRLRA